MVAGNQTMRTGRSRSVQLSKAKLGRSRLLRWGLLSLLSLTLIGTCRQVIHSRSGSETSPQASFANPPQQARAPLPTEWPGLKEAQAAAPVTVQMPPQAKPTAPRLAVVQAQDPGALVTVRSQPSVDSEALGYGQVGDQVILQREAADPDGQVWRYVTLPDGSTSGWIRGDFLQLQALPAVAAPDTPLALAADNAALKAAVDETCSNGKAIAASFVTQSQSIYLCKVRGQHIYLSQEEGTQRVIQATEVEAVGDGYFITNGNFEYRLDPTNLVIVQIEAGKQTEVLREAVLYTERY